MWPCLPGPKYFVSPSNALQIVEPFFFAAFASRHSNDHPPHAGSSGRPRCFLYHAWVFFAFFVLKKIPPRPVTRWFVFISDRTLPASRINVAENFRGLRQRHSCRRQSC